MMMKRLVALLLCVVGLCGAQPSQIDACTFDAYVLGLFNENAVSDTSRRHLELLDFVTEFGPKASPEICSDKAQMEKLIKIAFTLYSEKASEREYPQVFTRYAAFAGREESGRIATDEDNAAYNMLLDFMIAKYDSWFAGSKSRMLAGASNGNSVLTVMIAEKLFDKDHLLSIAKTACGSVSSMLSKFATSWANLWFMNESPLGRSEKFDFDYSWILNVRDHFLQRYPDSRYKDAVVKIMDDDIASGLRAYDQKDEAFRAGICLSLGKTVSTSAFDDIDEILSLGLPQLRLQYRRFVFQFQVDGLIGSKNSATGMDVFLGYSLELGNFDIDFMAGLGFMEFAFKSDSVYNAGYSGSVQIMKRLPIGDALYISPKFQWIGKAIHYDDPFRDHRRWGMMNHLLLGVVFEARIPLSKWNAKEVTGEHPLERRSTSMN